MTVRKTIILQYARIANAAVIGMPPRTPPEGWVTTMRKALGMSVQQLATRLGVHRSAVYQAEKSEMDGSISLAQMERIAAAMGAKFVYSIVPDCSVEKMIGDRAFVKATSLHRILNAHMALEGQGAPDEELAEAIQSTADEITVTRPRDLWVDR